MRKIINKSIYIMKQYGFSVLFLRLLKAFPQRTKKINKVLYSMIHIKRISSEISNILHTNNFNMVDIQHFSFGWNVTLFQRPQHLARNLARKNVLVLYGMHPDEYSSYSYPVHKMENNLYSVDIDNPVVLMILKKSLKEINVRKFYHVYSTNDNYTYNDLLRFDSEFTIIYEYIDSIKLSKDAHIKDRHDKIVKMKNIKIVITANELLKEIDSISNCERALIPNGVEYEHWNDINKENIKLEFFEDINKNKSFIVGYYGALTRDWFDFELIEKIAKIESIHIILIGPLNYKGPSNKSSQEFFDKLKQAKNITLLDSISYEELPIYAKYFDVAIIPFLVNDITAATSPVKLFEYMAMGKPIVTTYLPECLQFSTVKVTNTHEEFIGALVDLKDNPISKSFANLQRKEAKKNTWEQKADQLIKFMNQ